jgi:hypothetical protein
MFTNSELINKWKPLLESEAVPAIEDSYRKAVTARLLENQEVAQASQREALNEDNPINVTGNVAKYDPVMISLVRRSMPKLIAYDLCGVQPMTGPTGLIFAMRPKYIANGALGADAFYNEPNSQYTGDTPADAQGLSIFDGTYGQGMATAKAEQLNAGGSSDDFQDMGFEIEKVSVTAKTRALRAQYSVELTQDLKQIHGLDAETELAAILSSEILAEINREVIRTLAKVAKVGAQNTDLVATGSTSPGWGGVNGAGGIFDLNTDSNGRWAVEKFKGLMFQIEREANQIAKETRRGKGNVILCSSDVASALAMAGLLDTGRGIQGGMALDVDPAGNTYAGVLNGRYKVYVDPYHIGENFIVVGYKGSNAYDAGMFYAPYIPLQMFKTVDTNSFQPKMGFKTRYGMVANPFAEGTVKGAGALNANANVYYRKMFVRNLAGSA